MLNERLSEVMRRLALVEAKGQQVGEGGKFNLNDPEFVAKIGEVYEPKFV